MGYPESVLTKNKSGEAEVRNLLDRGSYVRYNYIDPSTGVVMENGKFSVILKGDDGKEEHYFMIPMKGSGFLAIPQEETREKERKLWDEKKKKPVNV